MRIRDDTFSRVDVVIVCECASVCVCVCVCVCALMAVSGVYNSPREEVKRIILKY